jgi:hypothetical protein
MIDSSSFILGAAVGFVLFGAGLVIGMIIGSKLAEWSEEDNDELENEKYIYSNRLHSGQRSSIQMQDDNARA